MAAPKRILVLGSFGGGNFGNDAAFEAAMLWLRKTYTQAEFFAVCANPVEAKARLGLSGVALRVHPRTIPRWLDTLMLRQPSLWMNWRESLRALRGCDLLVVAGTGVIHDFRDRPWGWPSIFLRWMLAARVQGTPAVLACVGAGPVINPLSRRMMKWCAELCARRSYRDEDSRSYMSALGVDERHSTVLADLAFILPAHAAESPSRQNISVCIAPMNYRGWRRNDAIYRSYIDAMVRLTKALAGKGYALRAAIGQSPSDLSAVTEIEERTGLRLMSDDERRMQSFGDVMRVVSACEVVIASRYHVQIAALKMRRPVLSLSYGPMNDALMQRAGLSEFVQNIEKIDQEVLIAQAEYFISQRAHFQGVVDERIAAIEAALPAQLDAFLSEHR